MKLLARLYKAYATEQKSEQKKLPVVELKVSDLGKYAITKQTKGREEIMRERRAMIKEVAKDDSDRETQDNKEKSAKAKKATTQMIEGTEKVSVADFELLKVRLSCTRPA